MNTRAGKRSKRAYGEGIGLGFSLPVSVFLGQIVRE
jgi:hypothetical protein